MNFGGVIATTFSDGLVLRRGGASASTLSAVSGIWTERGSGNQAGRVNAAHYDAEHNRLIVLSAGGNIWRAQRDTLTWTVANDSVVFLPYSSDGYLERLGGLAGERLLVASDQPNGVFFSDDGGSSFKAASGLELARASYAQGLAIRDPQQTEAYFLRNAHDPATGSVRPHLFASAERGASWSPLGFVGARNQVALFSPRYDSAEVYLLAGQVLSRIAPGSHALLPIATLPAAAEPGPDDWVSLTGGVTSGQQTFLYAAISRGSTGGTDIFRSLDGGLSWSERTPVPYGLFDSNSVESSTSDPDQIYAGTINLFRSHDGAASWTAVNEWHAYHLDPAHLLHADITNIDSFRAADGSERLFISTDGGLYESQDGALTVNNLSLNHLRTSQYYDVFSARAPAQAIMVGAQDQGYQFTLDEGTGIAGFQLGLSGDQGNLDSSDGGQTLWYVSPAAVALDLAPVSGDYRSLRLWYYGEHGLSMVQWMAPLVAVPGQPLEALLGGGNLGTGGHRLLHLRYDGERINASESAFDFAAPLTALAISPHAQDTVYVLATPRESGSRFYRGRETGDWRHNDSVLQTHPYFYGNAILPDPVQPSRLYVAGSGYSNPAVFVSTDEGDSFQAMATGLPATMVNALAISPDAKLLFAATEVGPFLYDQCSSRWQDLSALGAPNQRFTDVEYVAEQNLARFATFGRGVWDFSTSAPIDTDRDGAPDCIDTDDDNDGVADASDAFPLDGHESVDTDGDGTGNNADSDDDNDGHPDSADLYPLDPSRWQAETDDGDGGGGGGRIPPALVALLSALMCLRRRAAGVR